MVLFRLHRQSAYQLTKYRSKIRQRRIAKICPLLTRYFAPEIDSCWGLPRGWVAAPARDGRKFVLVAGLLRNSTKIAAQFLGLGQCSQKAPGDQDKL